MALATGQTLAHYEILGPIGAGGMGEVWRARDTRLDREVAIKVLPEELACEGPHLSRFEREARTLAALNHPNLAHVYGIEQAGGVCFIAMELVAGEDLETRLSRGSLRLEETLDVCRQIAAGLEAAHESGVVHRDLKPANVRCTPEGDVKVIDFGLAKVPAAQGSHASVFQTQEGRILGTPAYMAPEQLRGAQLDRRVDVWAFGCVLYECLANEPAFGGESLSDVVAAVLGKQPDLDALPPRTPARLRALIERCLRKDARRRLRDLGDARIELEDLAEGGAAADLPGASPPARMAPGALLVALVGGGLLAWSAVRLAQPRASAPNPLEGATFSILPDHPGNEFDAAISPDGNFIAFGSERDRTPDVWVAQVAGGDPVNLTGGRFAVRQDAIRNVGFVGNGSRVWFMTGPTPRLLSVPVTGGAAEPLFGPELANADWTRDSSRIAYHTHEPGDPIHVRAVDGPADEPILEGLPGIHQHFPVWSFDERWIYVARGGATTGVRDMNLWRMRPDGSQAEQLTFDLKFVAFPTPIDEDTVLFVAQSPQGAGPCLWSLDVPTRSVRRSSIGTEHYVSISADDGGRRLVAVVENPAAALWRVPVLSVTACEEHVELLPGVRSAHALGPQYGGGDLFFLSSRGSGDGLWRMQDARAREIWPGSQEPLSFLPSVSPDGKRAALARNDGARMVLSIIDAESGQTLRICDDSIDVRGGSAWSPSGDRIVVGGVGPEGPGLFELSSHGGAATLLVAGLATDPAWSPTDDLIVYAGEQVGPQNVLRAVRSDGSPVERLEGLVYLEAELQRLRFLRDGSGIVYLSDQDLWLLDLATAQKRQLTDLEERGVIRCFDVSPDGRSIVFDRIQRNPRLVLIELPARR